jgi:hypothetical protein
MKKQYISPESQSCELGLDNLLDPASIAGVDKGNLTNDIEMGGEAGNGQVSDSRRRDIWSDEEDGYEY